MRAFPTTLALLSIASLSATTEAAVIVQRVSLSQVSGDFPSDIIATPFDVAAGDLTDVNLVIAGTYTPGTSAQSGVMPAATDLVTALSVHAYGGSSYTVAIGSQPSAPVMVGGHAGEIWSATGTSASTFQSFDFGPLMAFAIPLSGPQPLANYAVRTTSPLGFSVADHTNFQGQAVLTYSYTARLSTPSSYSLLILPLGWLVSARYRRRDRVVPRI